MDSIYLDNNSTTALLPEVWEAMAPFAITTHGNPGSNHSAGRRARQALQKARETVASCLHAHGDEVIFTSGATEANNLALLGLIQDSPGHLLSSPLEHPSVQVPLQQLARRGYEVELLPCDSAGQIDGATILERIKPSTQLLTCMLANNETGTLLFSTLKAPAGESILSEHIQEQTEWVNRLREANIPFHCDATQAVGRIPVDFARLGVTVLTASAHKFHGPRGIGLLLNRRGSGLKPQQHGGNQEQGIRPGTEPVFLIVGLAKALELACQQMEERSRYILQLRTDFLANLRENNIPFFINGSETGGIPHTLNLSFPGIKAATLQMNLDLAGVACSTGSACTSGSMVPSRVLQAMKLSGERVQSALRFSLSHRLSRAEIIEAANRLGQIIRRLKRSA